MKRKKKYRRDLEGEPPPITKYGRKKIERRREESPLADALMKALDTKGNRDYDTSSAATRDNRTKRRERANKVD